MRSWTAVCALLGLLATASASINLWVSRSETRALLGKLFFSANFYDVPSGGVTSWVSEVCYRARFMCSECGLAYLPQTRASSDIEQSWCVYL